MKNLLYYGRAIALAAALCASALAAPTATTVVLQATPASLVNQQFQRALPVKLSATVLANGHPMPGYGVVRFCVTGAKLCQGSSLIGQAQWSAASGAVIHPILSVGTHSITAVFAGNGQYAPSTSSAQTVAVQGAHSVTQLTATKTGATYSLTATVTGSVNMPLSGNVTFFKPPTTTPLATVNLGPSSKSLWFSGTSLPFMGSEPLAMAAGDFNGDGFSELAVAGLNSNTVEIVSFTNIASTIHLPGIAPMGIATGDFNSDGKLDLAVAESGSGDVAIYLGNGDLTFNFAGTFATGGYSPVAVASGDFNNDGIPDLAVANLNPGMVTLLAGNGTGAFSIAGQAPTDWFPYALVVADFNNDGKLDVATANYYGFDVTVLAGNGQFGLQQVAQPNTGVYPDGITVEDFNGDGKLDLAVSNQYSNDVTILLGKGDGTFNPTPVSPGVGNSPADVVSADFNRDGIPDLAVSSFGDNSVTILIGKGDGTFTNYVSYATGNGTTPHAIALGDLAGLGFPDFAVADSGVNRVQTFLDVPAATATATLSNVSFTPGVHTPAATYNGNATYWKSTGETPIGASQGASAGQRSRISSLGFSATGSPAPPIFMR